MEAKDDELAKVPRQLEDRERELRLKLEVELRHKLTLVLRDSIADELRQDLDDKQQNEDSEKEKKLRAANKSLQKQVDALKDENA